MKVKNTIELVVKHCNSKLDFENPKLGEEYNYASLPLCVVDSVFSIGIKYETVKGIVKRLCDKLKILEFKQQNKLNTEISTTDILNHLDGKIPEFLNEKIFTRQKTSTNAKKGILKADAVVHFLIVLKNYNVETFKDIDLIVKNDDFDEAIKKIPGQSSGISLKYFFMLAGNSELIKPDRMINAFLNEATGMGKKNKFSFDDCQEILTEVVKQLKEKHPILDARLLDYLIWGYQRQQTKA